MRGRAVLATLTALLLHAEGAARAAEPVQIETPAPAATDAHFPRPAALERRVRFWTKIFATYTENQSVLHDKKHVGKIYSVLELDPEDEEGNEERVNAEKQRIRAALLRVHAHQGNPAALSESDRKLFTLFRDVKEPDKYRAAAGRIRAQTGLRERFTRGLRVSRRYYPEMERIFREAGLPVELTRLPLIESTFDVTAYSKVGAAGVWQFMPATGRRFGLRVDRFIDERRDPVLSTRAAAVYLAAAHSQLGSWPLAITSYNHGPAGIARAVESLGTDSIVALVERYEGRRFGFAGQNFYVEFLAALDIDRDPERYVGPLTFEEAPAVVEVVPPPVANVHVVAQATGAAVLEIVALNPALGGEIVSGQVDLPAEYPVRIPEDSRAAYERNVAALAGRRRAELARAGTHRVNRGQTLSGIAARYGVSLNALRQYNGISNANVVRVGQVLRIPPHGSQPRSPAGGSGGYLTHRVRRGQTLSHIARQYGTSVSALKRQNGIRNPASLRVGQVIKVPTS